ncbi:MAG: hypothetical protein LIP08_16060, partial [Bacteroides sp.]|nr:hypothetical protein [Bacteroides sp.]
MVYSQNAPNIKVTLHLDDYLCSEEQWVYIRGYNTVISGSEYFIFDSAYVAKGQHLVEFNYYIPYEQIQYILFSKMGPDGFYFEAEPDMSFEIDLGVADGEGGGTKMIKGGTSHNEERLFYDRVINPLKNKITECSERDPVLLDSIDY